eukprot:TRINITY_DN50694_c0_g1_i1.p2 TRINITY_DN50694_c0_g1~~TRINITY_DN50694_c0_g1_i1.p2  ORF type:complete len:298 (-),score=125.31 TRINITY_DN50694_c0_g1_i1:32-874(-)
MTETRDKVALVTGAANGIGAAFCDTLLHHGAMVAMADVDVAAGEQRLEVLREKHGFERVLFVRCDVTKVDDISAAFDAACEFFGRDKIDILCNNAGINEPGEAFWGASRRDRRAWKRLMDINLTAVLDGVSIGLRRINRGGVIVNTASMAGLIPMPGGPAYTASKFAVIGLTRSVAMTSVARFGVRVNCICPSFTNTKLVTDALPHAKGFAAIVKAQGPLLLPSLIADGMMQLVTDGTRNGAVMRVTQQNGIDYERYRRRNTKKPRKVKQGVAVPTTSKL